MTLAVAATVATVGALWDPKNAYRTARSATQAVQKVASGTINVIQGAYFGELGFVTEGFSDLGQATMSVLDTAVYGIAVVIPIIPIGFTWSAVRRQT